MHGKQRVARGGAMGRHGEAGPLDFLAVRAGEDGADFVGRLLCSRDQHAQVQIGVAELVVEGGRGLDAVDVGRRRHGFQPHVAEDAAQGPIVVGIDCGVLGELADAHGQAVLRTGLEDSGDIVGELGEPTIVASQRR